MTICDTALGRLVQQFKGRENLEKVLTALYAPLLETQACIEALRDDRWLDNATGVWLDIIGDIVGIARPYVELGIDVTFAYKVDPEGEEDPEKGFITDPFSHDPSPGGHYQSADGLADGTGDLLDDENYRQMIIAKTMANNRDGTIPDLYTYLVIGYGMDPVIDVPRPGQVRITTDIPLTQGQRATIRRDSPRLAGVNVDVANWP